MSTLSKTFSEHGYPERWIVQIDSGTLTDAEDAALNQWLDASPTNRLRFAELSAAWFASAAVQDLPAARRRSVRPWATASWRSRPFAMAASVALTVLVFMAWPRLSSDVYVAAGEPAQRVTLNDGSEIVAAPGARLRMNMDGPVREVQLIEGEAVFEVERDVARPFVVQAGPARVEVTGTQFGVAVDGDRFGVALLEGSIVMHHSAAESVKLRPEDHWVGDQTRMTRSQVAAQDRFAWAEGQHVFVRVPLDELLTRLEPFVGVPIHNLAEHGQPITATLRTERLREDIDHVLKEAGVKVTRLPGLWFVH